MNLFFGETFGEIGNPSYAVVIQLPAARSKDVIAKVYSSTGVYITTWSDWVTKPTYRYPLNGGPGSVDFELPRRWGYVGEQGDYASLDDVMLGNYVEIITFDLEAPSGIRTYYGRLSHYEQSLAQPILRGQLIPLTSRFTDYFIEGPLTYTDQDPSVIIQALITAGYTPGVTWDPSNTLVGTPVTITIERQKMTQVLDTLQQAAGGFWFWRLDIHPTAAIVGPPTPSGHTLVFAQSPVSPNHLLTVGKEIAGDVVFSKSDVQRYQRVIVYGGKIKTIVDGEEIETTERYTAQVQSWDYNPTLFPADYVYFDDRIDDAGTAQRIANALLEFYNVFEIDTEVTVIDSNGSPAKGYDLESFKPGQTVQVRPAEVVFQFHLVGDHIIGDGHVIGGDWYSQVLRTLIIAEVDYRFDSAVLRLQTKPNRVVDELLGLADRVLIEGTR